MPDLHPSELTRVLVCPVTRKALVYDPETNELISQSANLAYPIRDGIPVMLPEEARKLETHPERRKQNT
ncbi:MAG: Trm112 family protein [Alphaproteobacteria bacterium]|nr:MAG: Trm112 family protein [Alphaproteobacteria bacterium]